MKKVRCISTPIGRGWCLTEDKVYNVINENYGGYGLIDDKGDSCFYRKDYFEVVEWTPHKGEMVEVRNYDNEKWIKREYIATADNCNFKYIAYTFRKGDIEKWKQMRQIKEDKLDIKITVNGEEKTIEELNQIINK